MVKEFHSRPKSARAWLARNLVILGLVCVAILCGAGPARAALVADGRIDVAVLNVTSRDASFWQEANLATVMKKAPGSTPFKLRYITPADLGASGLAAYDILVIPTDQRDFLPGVPGASAAIKAWVESGGVLVIAPGDSAAMLGNDPIVSAFGPAFALEWASYTTDYCDNGCVNNVPRAASKLGLPLGAGEPLVHVSNEIGAVFTACDRVVLKSYGSAFHAAAQVNSRLRSTLAVYLRTELASATLGEGTVIASSASYVINSTQHQQLAENMFRAAKVPADTTPPTVVFSAVPPAVGHAQLEVSATVIDLGGVSSVKWILNGAIFSSPTPDDLGVVRAVFPLVEGPNTIMLRAADVLGNVTYPSFAVTLDTSAPVVHFGPGVLLTNDPAYLIAGTATDNSPTPPTVRILVNGELAGTPTPGAGGAVSAPGRLAEGINVLTIEATDLAGNTSSAVREVRLDTVPPTVLHNAQPACTKDGSIDVSGQIRDDFGIASAKLTVNGVVVASPTPDVDGGVLVTGVALVEGLNTLLLTATDLAGNATASQIEIVRDSIAPAVAIVAPNPSQAFGSSAVPFTVAVTDAAATTVTIAGHLHDLPEGGGRVSTVVDLPAEGYNTVTVTATDCAGNTGSASVEVLLDFTAPVVTTDLVDGTRLGPIPGDQLPITLHVDDISGTTVHLGADDFALERGGGVVQSVVTLHEGQNVVVATIVDETGRTTSVIRTVTYDVTPPVGAFTTPAEGATLRLSSDLVVTATDNLTGVAGVTVQIDDGAPLSLGRADGDAWGSAVDTTTLPDGAHTATAVITDGVGNHSVVTTTFNVDNTAPTVSVSAPAPGAYLAGTITITAVASDAGSGVGSIVIEVNGVRIGSCAGATSCALPFDTTTLPDGPFRITATAMDQVGNEAVPAQISDIADNSAPARFILAPLNGSIINGFSGGLFDSSMPVTINVQDPGFASVSCTITGVAGEPIALATPQEPSFTVPFDSAVLLDGPAVVRCVATDLAGNIGIETSTVTVKNWYTQLSPRTLSNTVKQSSKVVEMWVYGPSVQRLFPTAPFGIQLLVPGSAPIALLPSTAAPVLSPGTTPPGYLMKLQFSRTDYIAAIKAGVASGRIDPARPVKMQIVAQGKVIASDQATLVGF